MGKVADDRIREMARDLGYRIFSVTDVGGMRWYSHSCSSRANSQTGLLREASDEIYIRLFQARVWKHAKCFFSADEFRKSNHYKALFEAAEEGKR